MPKSTFTPWHSVVELRDDLRTGELSLSIFAADLYDVTMGRAKPIYQDPTQFFSLTYPTFNLREMARDVMLRLAGRNDRAVLQLELTYGGGKTHSLITLYHLVNDPKILPNLPAVQEFRQHAGGITPPQARVAALCFDKLDVEKGMEVLGPGGESRWVRHPWSAMAFQIAGSAGLRLLHAEGEEAERETPPAENLLRELLAMPEKDGLATLILIDEVLMYAREKVGLDRQWRHRLQDFFQALTQAVTKVPKACVVASLLATDPRKSDELGKELTQELYNIFRREREQGVQPVEKQDVAEVLRRRFFKAESIRDREGFRASVVAALEGIAALDEATRKDRKAQEERYLDSYPFHPELTEALYTKWTQMEGFQRTRGVLRTFALALRQTEKWDSSPLVGANILLSAPGQPALSEGSRELASIAATEEYEGKRQDWNAIIEGELAKARNVQAEFPALKGREVEQAVLATFLHSQPVGQRALTRDLLVLLGAGKPDKIEIEKALLAWTDVSWFLDEDALAEGGTSGPGPRELPKSWRLGSKPNLTQMHSECCNRVSPNVVDQQLDSWISKEKRLTAGASATGARVHTLPPRPADVEDDGQFHYIVLGPKAASEINRPSAVAKSFLEETTSPDRPRIYRNAVLAAVPSRDGLDLVKTRIRDYLGWQEVAALPEAKGFDDVRKARLAASVEESRKKIPDAIVQAYNLVVTVSAKGEFEAFRITPDGGPLFETIKKDQRSRIQESAISPEALLPEGPYNLWRPGETARRASDLLKAFPQFPHLPKMLRQKDIADTLALGTEQGHFVLGLTRPDGSSRTIWRVRPTDQEIGERDLEVVLPAAADMSEVDAGLLAPGALPGLWPEDRSAVTVSQVLAFFDGGHVCRVPREGWEDTLPVPKACQQVVEAGINEAVQAGLIWLTVGPTSIYREQIPLGVLTAEALLNPPPDPIAATQVLPQNLPDPWKGGTTTALAISNALSAVAGINLPWVVVRAAIDGAIRSRLLEATPESTTWPCEWPGAATVGLRVPAVVTIPGPQPPPAPPPGRAYAEGEMDAAGLQDLAEGLSAVLKAGAGLNLKFVVRLEVREGAQPTPEQLAKLNEALAEVGVGLKFETK